LGLVVYLLPYMFVYNNALLLKGSLEDILLAAATGLMGVFALSCGLQGFMFRRTKIYEQIMCFVSAIALIKPGWVTDLIGVGMLGSVVFMQWPTILIDLFRRVKKPAA